MYAPTTAGAMAVDHKAKEVKVCTPSSSLLALAQEHMPWNFVAVVFLITDMLSLISMHFNLNLLTLSRAVLHQHARPRVFAPVIHQLQSGRRVSVSALRIASITICHLLIMYPFLVYNDIVTTAKTFVRDSTMVRLLQSSPRLKPVSFSHACAGHSHGADVLRQLLSSSP
jgi:hypothetical protein